MLTLSPPPGLVESTGSQLAYRPRRGRSRPPDEAAKERSQTSPVLGSSSGFGAGDQRAKLHECPLAPAQLPDKRRARGVCVGKQSLGKACCRPREVGHRLTATDSEAMGVEKKMPGGKGKMSRR